jgi:hypothetical protein
VSSGARAGLTIFRTEFKVECVGAHYYSLSIAFGEEILVQTLELDRPTDAGAIPSLLTTSTSLRLDHALGLSIPEHTLVRAVDSNVEAGDACGKKRIWSRRAKKSVYIDGARDISD